MRFRWRTHRSLAYAVGVRRLALLLAAAALAAVALPASSLGHAERSAFFPNHEEGSVPVNRFRAPSLVVCKPDSGRRIRRTMRGRILRENLGHLRRCRFRHIQQAVNAARNGHKILILPGVYREEPSVKTPEPDPKCEGMYEQSGGLPLGSGGLLGGETGGGGDGSRVPSYEYQRNCPNAQNLIAVIGDGPDEDRRCDQKCNIQIKGTGRKPGDVMISGERSKLNVIRADRADGIYMTNFAVEYSDFNNIYVLETNGFRMNRIISRYSREYGFLSFTSDNGVYENLRAYGSGDSGIYPGSGPEGHCKRYGIEIRSVDSYGNTIGYSGTAGNGVYAHDNKFHDNATGMTTDSFAPGHPGMPQDCARWENNHVYSNNADLFNDERDAYCKRPPAERDPKVVCPTFQVPVGTGILIAGGNGNIIKNNFIYDNWRDGAKLFWVPASARGEEDPTKNVDTSFENRYDRNRMGVRPDGARDPNGNDFWWDEEGMGNCWTGNTGPGGGTPTSKPPTLPDCPGSDVFSPGNPSMTGSQAPCAAWDPRENTDPPGCDWFTRPPEPR